MDASWATNCPTRVILNAVFLIVSQTVLKSFPFTLSSAVFTTPGPLTPTLITASPSVTPWNAPAINGLSSGALQKTTNLAQPMESLSFVSTAVSFTTLPIKRIASISSPVFVEPTFTELQIYSVVASAFGIDKIRFLSACVIFFDTSAV